MFAPPHSLSQRTTSFIASQRQGIHRIPLLHLIALIIDIHHPRAPSAELTRKSSQANPRQGYDRKDQFCFKHVRERAVRRRSRLVCSQPENPHGSSGATGHTHFSRCQRSCAHRLKQARSCHMDEKITRPDASSEPPVVSGAGNSVDDPRSGGARRDRTDDLMLAKHALSQLSYGPVEGSE